MTDRSDILARIDYFQWQEVEAWNRIEECQDRVAECLAELAMMEIYLGLDES